MAHFHKQVLSILLTDRCNLRCTYCYLGNQVAASPGRVIDLEFAKKGVDDFFAQFDSRAIRFYAAGEPTLELDLMKEIKKYAESKTDGRLYVELQTNGVFPLTTAEWIAENVDIVWISCDGMPSVHDAFRHTSEGKPTSSIIEKNIRFLVGKSRIVVGVRSTISSINVNKQVQMVKYFHNLGVKALQVDLLFELVCPRNSVPLSLTVSKPNPMEFARNFLVAWKRAQELGLFYGSSLTWNFDEPTHYACRACLPCPHLTPDGYVSACDMAVAGDSPLGELLYGVYDRDKNAIIYDETKIEKIRTRTAENMVDCQGCEVLYNCAGGCLGEALNETGSLFRVKKEYCEAIRFLAKNMPTNAGLYPYFHP